jgi:hypothetical protein
MDKDEDKKAATRWAVTGQFAPICPECEMPLSSPWYEMCDEPGTHDNETAQYECECGATVEFRVHVVPRFDSRIVRSGQAELDAEPDPEIELSGPKTDECKFCHGVGTGCPHCDGGVVARGRRGQGKRGGR